MSRRGPGGPDTVRPKSREGPPYSEVQCIMGDGHIGPAG